MMPIMAQVFSILSTGRWPLAETRLILWRRGRHDARWGGAAIFETTRTPRHRAGGDPPCILWERRHRRDFRADATTTASPRVPGGHKGGAPTIFGRSEHRAPHAIPPRRSGAFMPSGCPPRFSERRKRHDRRNPQTCRNAAFMLSGYLCPPGIAAIWAASSRARALPE